MLPAVAWTLASLLALLLAENARHRPAVWCAKPAASLGFVALACLASDPSAPYAHWILAALLACALGDVLLIPIGQGPSFLAGMAAFAFGHACYAVAFASLRPVAWAVAAAALAMLAVALLTLRWLEPHLNPPMTWAVRGYMLVIGAMVALAVGASVSTGDVRIGVGAAAFAASDLSVARDRFVQPSFVNLLWGLPLYYVAQLVLAWTSH